MSERALTGWRRLSFDAKVVGAVAIANWVLLFGKHYSVQATSDAPLWQLFPGIWAAVFLAGCGLLAFAYPVRDLLPGAAFGRRGRVLHLAAIVATFVVLPTIASIVLRETGKPYTYVHDGAIMVEEAARKLLGGANPYVADYLDTPLFYWPMINNPALYHFTYYPLLFLVTAPFVFVFDRIGLFWDQRYLYLPAYLIALALVPLLVPAAATAKTPIPDPSGAVPSDPDRSLRISDGRPTFERRLALVSLVALDPQLFPFVAEGRNDFFVLVFLFAGIVLLQRERRTVGLLAIAVASAVKLHAALLLPFVLAYLVATRRPRSLREAWDAAWYPAWPAAALLAAVFVPFLLNDFSAFYDDVVAYNAGGAAWSYPISGMGFSAILLAGGVIEFPQQEFPFAAFQLAAAVPLAAWSLRALWRRPSIARMLGGYALTLLAFLFFARYFHGNYLGHILAVAAPILFLVERPWPGWRRRTAVEVEGAVPPTMPAPAVSPIAGPLAAVTPIAAPLVAVRPIAALTVPLGPVAVVVESAEEMEEAASAGAGAE